MSIPTGYAAARRVAREYDPHANRQHPTSMAGTFIGLAVVTGAMLFNVNLPSALRGPIITPCITVGIVLLAIFSPWLCEEIRGRHRLARAYQHLERWERKTLELSAVRVLHCRYRLSYLGHFDMDECNRLRDKIRTATLELRELLELSERKTSITEAAETT